MSFYYPPLSAEQLFFAYPDHESIRLFFDQTLGPVLDNRKQDRGMTSLGSALMTELLGVSMHDQMRLEKIFCVDGMAANVAALACWFLMKEYYELDFGLEEIADPFPDRMYQNRPLSMALLSSDLRVNEEGSIEGDMYPESIGLFDCVRRTVNQVRREGRIIRPISKVDDNLMVLVERRRQSLNTYSGDPKWR